MELEKILISQDDQLLEYIESDLSQYNQPFQKLNDAYEGLAIGKMTPDVFEEIKTGQTRKFIAKYQKSLEDDLDATKVFNPALRANLLNGTETAAIEFTKAVQEFTSFEAKPKQYGREETTRLTIEDISLKDGSLIISDESREGLLDKHCRYYIQSEEEHQLYDIISTICEKYKEYVKLEKKLETQMLTSHSLGVLDRFFVKIGGGMQISAHNVIGACSFKKRAARHR